MSITQYIFHIDIITIFIRILHLNDLWLYIKNILLILIMLLCIIVLNAKEY